MKKTKKYLAAGLALMLICLLFSGCGGDDGTLTISLSNVLEYDIAELYISPEDSSDWGESILGGNIFEYGESIKVVVEPPGMSAYDMMVIDLDGDFFYFYGLPLENDTVVDLVSTEDWYEAQLTPKKGETIFIEGEFEFGYVEEEIYAPTPEDPLDASIAMPGYESLIIPYPSTLQVIQTNDRFIEFDAVNDPDHYESIIFDLIELQGSYDQRLSNSTSSQAALLEIAQKICDIQFPGMFIKSIGADYVDSGYYYSIMYYVWMSGEVFVESSTTPVRGVVECRYYGPTGYILTAFTLADEGVVRNYFEIAQKMLDNLTFGDGWTTPQNDSSQWYDPGGYDDYYYDYDPWSDPGDYGYDYDDEWYEPNDYDPWSDPGDYGYDYDDEWYEPNDYDF